MSHVSEELQRKLDNLSRKPGVYLFKDQRAKVIYIGKARVLRNRVRSYFQAGRMEGPKLARLVSRIADLETIVTDSEMEALILEANLVKEYRPRYNITLKDDKSYPYIRVTSERFPRVFPTRKIVRDGSKYFGPYTDVRSMRELLKAAKRIFPIRSCNYALTEEAVASKKYKLCLDYHIKTCDGPCQGLQIEQDYDRTIAQVVSFISGKGQEVIQELNARMEERASKLRFEEAGRIRDQIQSIESFQARQKVVLPDAIDRDILAVHAEDDDACGIVFRVRVGKIIGRQHFYLSGVLQERAEDVVGSFVKQYYLKSDFTPDEIYLPVAIPESDEVADWLTRRRGQGRVVIRVPQRGSKARLMELAARNARLLLEELRLQKMKSRDQLHHAVEALQRDLNLAQPPRRIECFDISNFQGKDAVASMVTFINGRPVKSEYRKFKVRTKDTPDDFAMMAEAIRRRYSRVLREEGELPGLVLVDGGKGQLSAAWEVMNELGLPEQPLAALAKRLDEVFVPGFPDPQNIPRTSSGLRLLQQIRDETHRFGVAYHRTLRKKRTIQSELDQVPGVGEARRRALITHFGSVKKIREASVDEIAEVPGIPGPVAERIWSVFHGVGEGGDASVVRGERAEPATAA